MGNTDFGKYQELVEKYNPNKINICPKSADDLYDYYRSYTRVLLDCVFEEIKTYNPKKDKNQFFFFFFLSFFFVILYFIFLLH